MLDIFTEFIVQSPAISFSFSYKFMSERTSSVTQTLPRIACVRRPQSRNGIKKQESKAAGKDWMKSGIVSFFIPQLFKDGCAKCFDAKSLQDCFSQSLVADFEAV